MNADQFVYGKELLQSDIKVTFIGWFIDWIFFSDGFIGSADGWIVSGIKHFCCIFEK